MEKQERYHEWITRMLREESESKDTCRDCAEYGSEFCEDCTEKKCEKSEKKMT